MSEKMSPDYPHITVILPVYRSRDILQRLAVELTTMLRQLAVRYELMFVCDGCPDGSAETLTALCRTVPHMKVVVLKENVGQHRAVLTGMTMAKGDYIVVMDADLQDPPSALPALLNKVKEGYGAVFAGRRGRYESVGRLATSRIFKWLLHKVSGVPADAGMFFMTRQATARQIIRLNFRYPFVVGMVGCTGLPNTSIPVARRTRPEGHSSYSSFKRLKTALLALMSVVVWRIDRDDRFLTSPYVAPISELVESTAGG